MDFCVLYRKNGYFAENETKSKTVDSVRWIGSYYKVDYHTIDNKRIISYYSTQDDLNSIYIAENESNPYVFLLCGYIFSDNSIVTEAKDLDHGFMGENYYGTYLVGRITKTFDVYSVDEVGMYPIYYLDSDDYLVVGNNPHLMAVHAHELGLEITVEKSLALWYVTSITVESDCTGYHEIKRLRPFHYLTIKDNKVCICEKGLVSCHEREEALNICIKQMSDAIRHLNEKYYVSAHLTGGFDTRVILGLIMNANLHNEIRFIVEGCDDNPDVIIAKLLQKKFGLLLEHKFSYKKLISESVEDILNESLMHCIATSCEKGYVNIGYTCSGDRNCKLLTGFCAGFARPIMAQNLIATLERKFKKQIDINNLSSEEMQVAWDCLGYSDNDRCYISDYGWDIYRDNRKIIFNIGMNRFSNVLDTADSLHVYRMRNHGGGFLYRNNNALVFNNPYLFQLGRMYSEPERRNAK